MMRASIVLRIKNEDKTLREVLQKVFEQEYSQPYEVIIVDSGSTDASLKIAQEFETRIFEIEPEKFSWGYAINFGVEKSQGEFVVFLSSHCVPTNSLWLKNLLKSFDDPTIAGAYSRQIQHENIDSCIPTGN